MQNIVRLIGASMVNGAIVCQNCGRADTTITYCRTQNGKELLLSLLVLRKQIKNLFCRKTKRTGNSLRTPKS